MDEQYLLYIGVMIIILLVFAVVFMTVSLKKTRKTVMRLRKAFEEEARELSENNARLADDVEETRRDIAETRHDLNQSLQAGINGIARSLEEGSRRSDSRLEALRVSVEGQLSAIREDSSSQLRQIRDDNAVQLEKMRQTVDEKLQQSLDDRLTRSFASVRESLDKVYTGLGEMQGLAQGVGDLKRVLGNVKTRGILGEIQLKAILEQIMAPQQYAENTKIDPASDERVEFAIIMPGDGNNQVLLPIDAKFPADSYRRLTDALEANDGPAIQESRRQLQAAIKKDAADIRSKYICPPYSTEFAVMFLPFEGLYAEVVSLGLMETVQRDYQVMIAGPSTMAALLNSLQMGFRTLAIQKNAGKVWQVLGSVKTEFDRFEKVLTATQAKLNQAGSELDKLVGTRTRMIQKSLSRMQSLEGLVFEGSLDESTGLEELPESFS